MAQTAGEAGGRWGCGGRIVLALLIGQVAGIVAADRGIAAAASIGPLAAVWTGWAAFARARGSIDVACTGPALLVGLVALSFAVGHQALERRLERAREDAERTALLDPKIPRLVDALVRSRRATRFGEEVELVDVRCRAGDERVPERVVLRFAPGAFRADRLLWPGAHVRAGLYLSPLHPPRNPGSPDAEHALARRGFSARARLVKPDWVVLRVDPRSGIAALGVRLAQVRRDIAVRVRGRLEAAAPRDRSLAGAELVRALALGDRSSLSESTRDAFRGLGLAHLISVSGLHVGFVAFPAAWALVRLRTLARPRARPVLGFVLPLAAGCAVASGYAWLTGAGVPALRASLVFALVGIGRAAGVRIEPIHALATAALVLLLVDPALLFDLGARFSFAACAALIAGGLWSGPVRSTRVGPEFPARAGTGRAVPASSRPGLERVLGAMRASLAISLGMLPLIELAGMPRALPSPLVNALAIPWTGLVVLPTALAGSLLALVLPAGIGDPLLRGLLLPAAALEHSALALFAALPATGLAAEPIGRLPWAIALPVAAFALLRLRGGDWVSGALVWAALAFLGLAPMRGPGFPDHRPRVVFLDVGQADAALVQTRDETWLIDTGGGSDDGSGGVGLLRALVTLGVEYIDVLVITHGDLDHRGGALRVLSVVKVHELWLPDVGFEDSALDALERMARSRSVRVRRVGAGDRGGGAEALRVEVLWPPVPATRLDTAVLPGAERGAPAGGTPSARPGSRLRNDASIVLRLELAGRRFLFAGDAGADVERRLVERASGLRAEVLKVGHHGSRTSSDARFLAAVAPEIAIVSAPCRATRGLPSLPALDRLRAAGAAIGWTGRDGAISVDFMREGEGGTNQLGREDAGPLRMRYWGDERRCVPEWARGEPSREEIHERSGG